MTGELIMEDKKLNDEEHQFNKKNAQILTHQISCFLIVLKAYCDKYNISEDMDKIIMILKHILKLADSLYCELDTWEVINIDYE